MFSACLYGDQEIGMPGLKWSKRFNEEIYEININLHLL